MKRIKSAPANIALMVNLKKKSDSLTINYCISLDINSKNKLDINSKNTLDKNIKKDVIVDNLESSINEYISDPDILPIEYSPFLSYTISYIIKNTKKKMENKELQIFILNHIIRYFLTYMIHHHIFSLLNSKIQEVIPLISF